MAEAVAGNDLARAQKAWRTVAPVIPALFAESNTMPLEHCLGGSG